MYPNKTDRLQKNLELIGIIALTICAIAMLLSETRVIVKIVLSVIALLCFILALILNRSEERSKSILLVAIAILFLLLVNIF